MRDKIIYSFSFIFLLIFVSSNLFAYDKNYYDDRVVIRLKSGYENPQHILNQIQIDLNSQIMRVLPEEKSLTHNSKLFFQLQSTNLNYNKIIDAEKPLLNSFIIKFEYSINPKELCKKLKLKYDFIELAEPIYKYQVQAYSPNDTYFDSQTTLEKIKATDAWEIWKGDENTIVGVSDNGVYQAHEDLSTNLWNNSSELPNNNVDDDHNGYIDDFNGYNFNGSKETQGYGKTFANLDHGTQVAGIIGAKFNNSKGVAGISGNCKIFPIKISTDDGKTLEYANESIIFAATHKFKVLNLSWGGPRAFSEYEQSLIDYAVANDVAIVAAGGNIGTNGGTRYDTYYPGGYFGVLGVGEVDEWDGVTETTSSLGTSVAIMAPGTGNFTTNNKGSYSYVGEGTSYATPVISGAVALARSKYPNLAAIQSLEFVRQCVDNIIADNSNNSDKELIPGRINLLKVVSTNPFSIPAIKPIKFKYYDIDNNLKDRFQIGDTIKLKIDVKNYLGMGKDLNFKLKKAYDPSNSINIIVDAKQLGLINSNEEAEIGEFVFVINKDNSNKIIFKIEISNSNGYSDMFKFEFIPVRTFATFENENLRFSMSDIGDFGFIEIGNISEGAGFTIKGQSNQLYGQSGLMVSENNEKLASFFNESFKVEKKFISPESNKSIITDSYSNSSNKIGLEITQEVSFVMPKIVEIDLNLKNTSSSELNNLSVGYFFDWDINDKPDSNYAELFTEIESLPVSKSFAGIGAEIIYKPNENVYIGCVAISEEANSQPQIAGPKYSYTSSFSRDVQLSLLNSGKSIQFDEYNDRSIFVGTRFENLTSPNSNRKLKLLIGYNESRNGLIDDFEKALAFNSIWTNNSKSDQIEAYQNTNDNSLIVNFGNEKSSNFKILITDILGNLVYEENNFSLDKSIDILPIKLPEISTQVIIIYIISDNDVRYKKLLWQ